MISPSRLIGYATVALVVATLAVVTVRRLFPSNPPGPTKSEKTSDSLTITKPFDQALIDSSNARIVVRGTATRQAEATARRALADARQERQIADSLALVAWHAADSATAWHAAYDARNREAIDLRKTVVSDATIIFNLKADTTDLRGQLGVVNKRLKTTEDVNAGLRKDLEQARECKILGLVNCPSRVQSVALTAATYFVVDQFRPRK